MKIIVHAPVSLPLCGKDLCNRYPPMYDNAATGPDPN